MATRAFQSFPGVLWVADPTNSLRAQEDATAGGRGEKETRGKMTNGWDLKQGLVMGRRQSHGEGWPRGYETPLPSLGRRGTRGTKGWTKSAPPQG